MEIISLKYALDCLESILRFMDGRSLEKRCDYHSSYVHGNILSAQFAGVSPEVSPWTLEVQQDRLMMWEELSELEIRDVGGRN